MDFNIKRNSLENHSSGTRSINQPKLFQERSMKNRFKNKNIPINNDNKNIRNNKIKKNQKPYDDQEIIGNESNHVRLENKVESISYKTYNGDKFQTNVTYNVDRKFGINTKSSNNPRNASNESRPSYLQSKEKVGIYKPRDYKSSERQNDVKEKNINRREVHNGKIKWNFLQESQLNIDKLESASDKNKEATVIINGSVNSQRTSNNGLNPAAIEFTPNTTLSSVPPSSIEGSNTIQQITEAIESSIKTLSFNNDNVSNAISNPVVIDTPEYSFTSPQLSMFSDQAYAGKVGLIDSSLIQNVYQCRPLSRVNYPQNIVPQLQFLYGTNAHMIRYNQNIPFNFPGNYILCNQMLFNGMYNTTSPLLANRLVPVGAADIPVGNLSTHIAHSFNPNVNVGNYSSSYYTDSMNNGPSHIR